MLMKEALWQENRQALVSKSQLENRMLGHGDSNARHFIVNISPKGNGRLWKYNAKLRTFIV